MDYNIPVWTNEVLYRAYTVEEFLQNPLVQDLTVQYKITQLLKKYAVHDVASIWFSGDVLENTKHRADVNGTTVLAYTNEVIHSYRLILQ